MRPQKPHAAPGAKGSSAPNQPLDCVTRAAPFSGTLAPIEPTAKMCAAGAAAGGVAPDLAARIYKAMLEAV